MKSLRLWKAWPKCYKKLLDQKVVPQLPLSDLIAFQTSNTWAKLFLNRRLFILDISCIYLIAVVWTFRHLFLYPTRECTAIVRGAALYYNNDVYFFCLLLVMCSFINYVIYHVFFLHTISDVQHYVFYYHVFLVNTFFSLGFSSVKPDWLIHSFE